MLAKLKERKEQSKTTKAQTGYNDRLQTLMNSIKSQEAAIIADTYVEITKGKRNGGLGEQNAQDIHSRQSRD
jgi:hypothetical protein